jgi:hypothetical protein
MHVLIDEDTHPLRLAAQLSVFLKKRAPSKSIKTTEPKFGRFRKNLAVHVSLSSIFTMSKS